MKKMIILLVWICMSCSMASENRGNRKGPPQMGGTPPQEAIDICVGKAEGDECEVKTPHGDTLVGTCKTTPDNKYFVCMPSNMPKH